MAKQKNKMKKFKLITSFLGVSVIGGIAAIIASCSGPSVQTINNLFSNPNSPNEFSNSANGAAKNLVTNALLQNDGYQVLMKTKLAEILGVWYSKNSDSGIKNKYENYVADANDDWNNKVKDLQQQYGNDYQVKLQTDVLDAVGGTKENWIQDQINQKVFNDFTNQVFAKSFLNYTDPSGNVIDSPLVSLVNDPANWENLKFIAAEGSNPSDQMFAKFQDIIFDKWVSIENPNLVSRIVFTNDQPQNGLKEIFNENKIGISNLSPSYEFQVFKDNSNDLNDRKGTNAYKEISTNGLDNYYNSKNFTIDIPNYLSSDAGGKLLMTASDMFNSYDVAFTSAFVYQYLRMLGVQNDTITNKFTLPTATASQSAFNIMNNFIVDSTTSAANASSSTEYTAANPSYTNISNPFTTNDFYQSYSKLSDPTTKIFNVALPQAPASLTTSMNDIYDQFIFARGKDGVHIIGIDGGKYYLDSLTKSRNISKQETFLKYRAYLPTLPNGVNALTNYSFDLDTQLKTWFDAHQVSLIYQVLSQLDNENSPLLNDNADFKKSFEDFKNKFDNYINAFITYNQILNIQNDIDTMRSKLNEWGQTYSDDLKNLVPEKIGIAAKLPYVRAADGDYFGQLQYYLEILNKIDSGLIASNAAIGNLVFDHSTAGNTRKALIDEAASKYQVLKDEVENNLINLLQPEILPRIQYAQNIFIDSKNDTSLSLALNLVINATINSESITNSVKNDYLSNSTDFETIEKWKKNPTQALVINNSDGSSTTIDGSPLFQAIRNFYQQSAFNGLTDKTIYGNFYNKDDLDTKINLAWENQLGFNQYSNNGFNYNLFLYTLYYLLKDNLANFKAILASQIYQGVDAFVSWTMPANPDSLNPTATSNPINNFEPNPVYIQGAGWKNGNPSTNAVNEWFNTIVSGAGGDSATATKLNPNPFNDATNPYNYTSPTSTVDLYGFNGITTSNTTGGLNSNVVNAMFANYNVSGPEGSLYSFGTKSDLMNYIQNINNQIILDNFVKKLSTLNIQITNYNQTDAQGRDFYNFDQKKEMVRKVIELLPDYYFTSFTGFIGNAKASLNILDPKMLDTVELNKAYQASDPINEDGNRLTVMAALVKQINYQDVQNLGSNNWSTSSGVAGRLGLDLNTFLSIVVQQAQDTQTQSLAISYLIKNNAIDANQKGQRIVIGDKRLYDALGSQWVTKV